MPGTISDKQEWIISIGQTREESVSFINWFTGKPWMCPSDLPGMPRSGGKMFCGPRIGEPSVQVRRRMPEGEARAVFDTYRERFDALVAFEPTKSGSMMFPGCTIGGSTWTPGPRFYELVKVAGVRIRDRETGETILATGFFK